MTSVSVQDGASIVQAGRASEQGLNLADVWIYQRDRDGRIVEQVFAKRASFDVRSATWRLREVARTRLRPDRVDPIVSVASLDWRTRLGPQEFSDLIERPQSMTLTRLWTFAAPAQIGAAQLFMKRLHASGAAQGTILMILLALVALAFMCATATRHRHGRRICTRFRFFISMGWCWRWESGVAAVPGRLAALDAFRGDRWPRPDSPGRIVGSNATRSDIVRSDFILQNQRNNFIF
jgi:lipopolysaccharide export system permease protein